MNEEETRALARDELRKAFITMKGAADWYSSGYDEETHQVAWVIHDVAEKTVEGLTPEPEQEQCEHAYATDVKGRSLCQLCDEPRPSAMPDWCDACQQDKPCICAEEPVNPFSPKNTARQWADMIANLCRLAQDDGHPVWIENEGYGHPIRLRVGTDDTAPIVWGNDA